MKKFSFTFNKEEAIDYYTYILSSSTSNRLKQLFIMLSIPLLLILTAVFFKLDNLLVKIAFSMVAIIWLMIIFPRFWKVYTRINIGENFLKKNNLTKFEEVKVEVDENTLTVNGQKHELTKDIKIIKTKLLVIFFFPNQPIAIPRRVMEK